MTLISIILTLLVFAAHSCSIVMANTTCESEDGEESIECDDDQGCCESNGKVECCNGGSKLWILGVIFPIVLIICCFCFCYCIRRRTANNNIDWSCDARTFPNNDFCCLEANPVWSSYGRDDTVRTVETIPRVRRVNTVITTTFNQPSSIHPSIIYPSIPCTLPYSNPPCIPGAPPSSSHPSIPDAPPKYTEVCQTAEKPPLDAQL